MEIDQFAADIAHEICARECFAFVGEGMKPHSMHCQEAARLIRDAIRKICDPMQARIEGARMAKTRLDNFADQANAGTIEYNARELKRKIGAAFADLDASR